MVYQDDAPNFITMDTQDTMLAFSSDDVNENDEDDSINDDNIKNQLSNLLKETRSKMKNMSKKIRSKRMQNVSLLNNLIKNY